jgi:hypothetical protein
MVVNMGKVRNLGFVIDKGKRFVLEAIQGRNPNFLDCCLGC